jgi:methyl-accepting chemotaxis protein
VTTRDIRSRLADIRERQTALRDVVRQVASAPSTIEPDLARLRQLAENRSEVAARMQSITEKIEKTAVASNQVAEVAVGFR